MMDLLKNRIHKKFNKKGNISVLIMMVIITMITSLTLLINFTREETIRSSVNSVGNLTNQSILSEYNIELFNRYKILGYEAIESQLNNKIKFYFEESFKNKQDINISIIESNLIEKKLNDVQNFKNSMYSASRLNIIKDKVKLYNRKKRDIKPNFENKDNKTITSDDFLESLPSYSFRNSYSINEIVNKFRNLKSISNFASMGKDFVYTISYLDHYLNNSMEKCNEEGYFRNQWEYIICGGNSDLKNLRGVKRRIIAIREIMNMVALHKDKNRLAAIKAAAEILTPGIAAEGTTEAIIAAWALAESNNDYKLLIHGKKVPFIKDGKSWAVSLKNVLNKNNDYIDVENTSGNTYDEYLKALIYFVDENKRISRIMDIITMDMKYLFNKDFSLEEYNSGLYFRIKVNGKFYEFEKNYEK